MEKYDTLKAWGISKEDLMPKKVHEQQIKELNEQLYNAYGRIAKLTKKLLKVARRSEKERMKKRLQKDTE